MKFSIYNILIWTTLIAMGVWITFQNTRRVVTLDFYVDRYDLPQTQLAQSLWQDRSEPPPLELATALSIVNEACQHLETRRDLLSLGGWKVVGLTILSPELGNPDCWVYVAKIEANEFPHEGVSALTEIQVLILMDGTIAIDSDSITTFLAKAILEFPNTVDASSTLPRPPPPANGGVF